MKFPLYTSNSFTLPYDELIESFSKFEFVNESYYSEGKIKKQSSGANKYAVVKIIIEKNNNGWSPIELSWETPENEIPILCIDSITTTIKRICKNNKNRLTFRIVGGSFHPVDSSLSSFEIATFMAISNLIEFNNPKINSFK